MSSFETCRIRSMLALFALGALPAAQQERFVPSAGRDVSPGETLLLHPMTASWGELTRVSAKLSPRKDDRRIPWAEDLEIPVVELPLRQGEPSVLPGGSAPRVAPQGSPSCAGFSSDPLASHFDSQLDAPDSHGFSFIPPDAAGGVGPEHLMTMLNNKVLVTDRGGGNPSSADSSAFWSPLGTTPLSPTTTYPRVHYDARDERWIASARNGETSTGSTSIFFAISRTSDPTSTWDFYSFPADSTGASFADWVVLGYNKNWITILANMFSTSGSASLGAKMWTIDKSTALGGGALTVNVFSTGFMTAVHGLGGTSPHPARTLDDDPTLWLVNDSFTSGGTFLLQLTKITGTGAAPVVSGLPGSPFGATISLCFASTNWSPTQRAMGQLGESRFISPFSIRIASVAVRNGKIWVANSGGLPGPSSNTSPTSNGVLWHELDPALPFPVSPGAPGSMVVQSGAVTSGTDTMNLYPSLAVNCAEDVLLGFANGDATRWPRTCYTFRRGADPLNTMRPIQELKAGESSYWKNFGVGSLAQYGRYTSAAVDPRDDKSLWTLQVFADTRVGPLDDDSRWGTCWGWLGGPRFFQVDFYGTHVPPLPFSTWGDLEYTARQDNAPLFLNLIGKETSSSPTEWLIQNLMLPELTESSEVQLRRFFDLATLGVSTGLPLTAIQYQLFETDEPFASMPTPGPVYITAHVEAMEYDQNGQCEAGSVVQYPTEPGPGPVVESGSPFAFLGGKLYRDDVPDIDEGCDECAPASVTRSLRWMHNKGLIDLGATTNAQLIANFKAASSWDKANGGVTTRNFLKGKLKVTKELHIVNKFMVRRPGEIPPGDFKSPDGTAVNKGNDPTFAFIKQELKRMEDIEIVVSWIDANGARKNGHAMTVIGFNEDTANDKKEIWVQDNNQKENGDKDQRRSTRYQDGAPASLKDLPRNRVEFVVSESPKPKKVNPR